MAFPRSLTDKQIDELSSLLGTASIKDLAEKFNISPATVVRYRDAMLPIGQIPPSKAKAMAIKNGEPTFHGRLCSNCHTTERRTFGSNSGRCVKCHNRKQAEYEARNKLPKIEKQKEKELLELLTYHKQNPQFSCVKWG